MTIRSRTRLALAARALLVLGIMVCALHDAAAVTVKRISWDSKVTYTRFVMEFDEAAKFNTSDSVDEKGLFYVDLYGIGVNYRRKVLDVKDNIISTVDAMGYQEHGVLRLVFYLRSKQSTFKVTQVDGPPRLVIDIVGHDGGSGAAQPETAASAPPEADSKPGVTVSLVPQEKSTVWAGPATESQHLPQIPEPRARTTPSSRGSGSGSSRKKVVVIDAGHGGSNRGTQSRTAVNGRTVLEKELTLQFALHLKKIIDSTPGMTAVLTRTGDTNLSLADRVKFAESRQGDLFVSVHMNDGAGNSNARGVEVFFLNEKGTGDAAMKAVEDRENKEVGDKNFFKRTESSLLKTILTDLERGNLETLQFESYVVCKHIMTAFHEIPLYRAHNRGIKSANFMVLKNFEMPAVLVEYGFLSNSEDTKYLVNPRFQQAAGMALVNAISAYFAETDPEFQATRHNVARALR